VLRTRDTSHVAAGSRAGLYRIHVRETPGGSGFQQRFEYVVKGSAADIDGFLAARTAAGDFVSERRSAGAAAYALLLTKAPVALTSGVSAVTFRELRSGDQSGELSWLWQRVDRGSY